MSEEKTWVGYEEFGAIGDGVADDLPAICKAHEHANAHGLSVRSAPDATYHLGRQALTAVIATDTDWSTSRFMIDDTDVEDHQKPLFEVKSLLEPVVLKIDRLERDQKQMGLRPEPNCYVEVQDDSRKVYIRRGLNRNNGTARRDCFILRRDGSIEGDIDWDYDSFTHIDALPIDDHRLTIRGGVFTTMANQVGRETGYGYWARNIEIKRSNTEVIGLTHYVVGETSVGRPYRGFLSASRCADITFRDCFATPHKIYSTIGAAGKPVRMGSYDLHANSIVNFAMIGCRMNLICDRTRWGVVASNFCKNILLEDCTLSRMDTHMGVSGAYTIRNCNLGYMGLNAIGRGLLTVENSTLYGHSLINFRPDYGSTWDGDVEIRNSRWIPSCGDERTPYMFSVSNDGMHDFGYPCTMPREIRIDGLHVDDSNHPADYEGMYLFNDPDGWMADDEQPLPVERPFPYAPCRKMSIRGLTTASGKEPRVSPNAAFAKAVAVGRE